MGTGLRDQASGIFSDPFSERKDTHSISPGLVFVKPGSELVKSLITDAKLGLEQAAANTGLHTFILSPLVPFLPLQGH